jgi:hypothetical protein
MNKLYWIVCDEKETNIFEGRYQGRTRGEALKFLKQSIGRKSLNGLVFTITEIPVSLIREIVAELLAGGDGYPMANTSNIVPLATAQPQAAPARYDAFTEAPEPDAEPAASESKKSKASKPAKKAGNPGHGDDLWSQVRGYWEECRNVKQTAERFGLSPNTLKTRIRREGWKK